MIFLAVSPQGRDGPARRQEIFDLVRREPGVHKSKIQRHTGLAWGTITHHLRRLQGEGKVRFHTWRGKTVVVPASMPERHMDWLLALRTPDRCRVLEALQQDSDRGIQDLCDDLQMSRKMIRAHLTILDEAGLLRRLEGHRPRFKPLRTAPDELARLLGRELTNEEA